MPKDPKDKENPLRQLRGLLASRVSAEGRARISQIELAKICEISANTIKKIEFASRRLNPDILTKVEIATGAVWNPEKQRWTRYDREPFTYEDYCEHRRAMQYPSTMDEAIKTSMAVLIHCRIEWLFENVPVKSWGILRVLVDESLEKCKRYLKLTKNDALFYRPWSTSAKDSAYTQFMKLAQQQLEHTPRGRRDDFRGEVAGDKKRKRKYGL